MYSRNFGGIQSDGQLQEMQEEFKKKFEYIPNQTVEIPSSGYNEEEAEQASAPQKTAGKSGGIFDFGLDFIKNLKIEDLIVIGIGIMLLLDNDQSNDILLVLIALLVLL